MLKLIVLTSFLFVISAGDAFSQWTPTTGIYGGSIQCMTSNSTTVFASPINAGVYRSTDDGLTWSPSDTAQGSLLVYSLVTLGTNIFAGSIGNGVDRSTDNGLTWAPANNGLSVPLVFAMAISGSNLYAGTFQYGGESMFRSTDSGVTWSGASKGIPTHVLSCFSMLAFGSDVLAGTFGGGMYLSSDSGANWISRSSGLPDSNVFSLAGVGQTIFAVTDSGLYTTSDTGRHWIRAVTNGLPRNLNNISFLSGKLYVGAINGLYTSSDTGKTWTHDIVAFPSISAQCFTYNGKYLFTGTSGQGAFRSNDSGVHWESSSLGINDAMVSSFTQLDTVLFAASPDLGIYGSVGQESAWSQLKPGLPFGYRLRCITGLGSNLFAGTVSGIFRVAGNGSRWDSSGLRNRNISAITTLHSNLFAGTDSGLFISVDGGASWSRISAVDSQVTSFAVYNDTLFAGTRGEGVFHTIDQGVTWVRGSKALSVSHINYLAANGTGLFAGTGDPSLGGGGIYRSTNFGQTWKFISSGLPTSVKSVSTVAVSGKNLYAGTFGTGIFRTSNNGLTWIDISDNLPGTYSSAMTIYDTNLYFAGFWSGVWKRPLSEISASVAFSNAQSSILKLDQNYPNPVRLKSSITFRLDRREHTTLTVHDMLGRVLRILLDGELSSGSHTVEFNSDGFSAGIYFYRLTAGGVTQTRQFVIEK